MKTRSKLGALSVIREIISTEQVQYYVLPGFKVWIFHICVYLRTKL
jgi:hypothetical protein